MNLSETNAFVSIRLMKDSDLPLVYRGLIETNWPTIPDDQRAVLNKEDCDKRIVVDFDRFLKEERYKFKVFVAATENDTPIGYVSVGEIANPIVGLKFGAVLDFWVDAKFRRRGIGGKLLDYAIEYIRERGYSHAGMLVSAQNDIPKRMYEKRGFEPDRITLMKRLHENAIPKHVNP